MARPKSTQPTDGELEILKLLWEAGPVELGALCAAMRRRRPVASTTVATMLKVMLHKGLVKRAKSKRGYLWSARITPEAAKSRLLTKLVDHLFDGSARLLVAHLVEDQRLSAADRGEIRALLAARRRREPPQEPGR